MPRYVIPDDDQFMNEEDLERYYENFLFDLAPNGHIRESYNGENTVWTVYGPNGHVLRRFERYDDESYMREVY